MAQGDFTKAEARETEAAFREVFGELSESKQREYSGLANDIFLFLSVARAAAPDD